MIKLHEQPLKIIRSITTNEEYAICLQHCLGTGGYGKVFKGFNNSNKYQKYAIKMIPIKSMEEKEKIEKEVTLVSELPRHQNLVLPLPVKIYSDNYFYIIMPYCNGGSLDREIIKRSKAYSEDEIYYIFYEIINGYKVLYDKDILHLDIKPGNVLIHEGRYKLADFGLSSLLNTKESNDFKGTVKYMCPEIIDKGYKASDKSDVYSIGVLMYMLIYKRHPYLSEKNQSYMEKLDEIRKNSLRKPSVIAQFNIKFNEFLDILTGMIQKNPVDRLDFHAVYQAMQSLPRIKNSYIRISSSYSFTNLMKQESSDTYNIPAYTSPAEEKEMVQLANVKKKLSMSEKIQTLKKEVESDILASQMNEWIESYRNILFFVDALTKQFQKDNETVDDLELRNCIYCAKLLKADIIKKVVNEFDECKVFSKVHWNLFKEQLDPATYNRVLKDKKFIDTEREWITQDPRFQSQLKLVLKHQVKQKENTLEQYLQFYNKTLRALFRKNKFQESSNIVTSIMILKMIDLTSDYSVIKEEARNVNEFKMKVVLANYSSNAKMLVDLAEKVKEGINAIDLTAELYEK